MVQTSFPVSSLNLLFFYQKREIGRVARKSIHKKWDTGRTKEVPPISINYDLTYTVIFAILQVADLPRVETDSRSHLKTSCNDAAGKIGWFLVFM